jgi:drug/metabolite transporter (DMT)-like permease
MTSLALVLVLSAACLHATWNLAAKRAGGGAVFVWLFSVAAALLYAPVAVIAVVVERPQFEADWLLMLVGSPALNLAYYLLLQRGYRSGDFSLVYPLVRGSAPVFTTIAAVALFHERPAPVAMAGTVLIVAGVILLAGAGRSDRVPRVVLVYGLITGASISAYTLWDKHAVSAAGIPPALLNWSIYLGQCAALAPVALRRKADAVRQWQTHRKEVLSVGILSPLAYLLVLSALAVSPVSYVAPMRELSILIGVVLGSRLLTEQHLRYRLAGAGAMVAGIAGLALA